jgi:hypothetical protein
VEADPHEGHARSQIRSHRPLLVAAPEPVHRRSSSSVEVAREQEVVLHVLVGHDMARHIIGEVEESVVLGVGGVRVHEHVAERAREAAVPGVDASSSSSTGGAAAFPLWRTGAAARWRRWRPRRGAGSRRRPASRWPPPSGATRWYGTVLLPLTSGEGGGWNGVGKKQRIEQQLEFID